MCTEVENRMYSDEDYMQIALQEASIAADGGDVPVGAVLVKGDEVIITAHNTREAEHTALGHAEINVIREGCRILNSKWLADCTLYVTLEPCPMCAGAILQARIPRVVYGAADPVAGAMGSVWALQRHPIRSSLEVDGGVCASASQMLLQDFFEETRMKKKQKFSG